MRPLPRLAILVLAVALLLAGSAVARAQMPALPGGLAAAPAEPQDAPRAAEAAAPGDIEALIQVLEDPAKREALLRRLKSAASGAEPDGRPAAEGEDAAPAKPETIADSEVEDLLAGTLSFVEERTSLLVSVLLRSAASVGQLPGLLLWLFDEADNLATRALLIEVGRGLILVSAAGLALAIGAHALLARSRRRLAAAPDEGAIRRLGRFVLRLLAELLPLALFLGATWIASHFLELSFHARLIGRNVLWAIALARSVAVLRRTLLYPLDGPGRILGVGDLLARQLNNWTVLIAGLGIYGYFALRIGLVLGLPWELHGLLEHLLFFLVTVLVIGMVLRFRAQVRDSLLHLADDPDAASLRRMLPLQTIADYWHVVAILWIALHFLVWALHLPDGFAWMARNNLLTLLTLVAARLAAVALGRGKVPEVAAAVTPGEQSDEMEAPAEARITWRKVGRVLIDLATVVALLLIWSPGLADWVWGPVGERVLASLLKIGVVMAFVAMLWTFLRRQLERYVSATDAEGNLRHSRRSRTVATVGRHVLFVLFAIFTAFFVLSEIGVNTAPLLAGAGVIGIAVGFGSQKLVQDIITGMFILLGDTLRVGDVVDLGGKSGVVEAISMRTITLRGYDGSVHTIPYSTVDIVTNMTKDFSYWVLNVGVAYREDVDQVMQVMTEIAGKLQREWPYRRLIIEPLEIAGVDAFADSAVMIKARIKTRPGEQWRVGRELNRRIKHRFDELGIEIPFPHQTIYFGTDKAGAAPPLRVEMEHEPAIADERPAPRIRTVGEA